MYSSYNESTFSLINPYKFFLTSVTAWCFNLISCLKLGQTARPVVSFFSPTNITQGGTSQGQITSRHLLCSWVQRFSRPSQNCEPSWIVLSYDPLFPSFGMSSMFTCLALFSAGKQSAVAQRAPCSALIYMMSRFCLSFCNRQAVLPFQRFNTFDPPGLNNSGGQI